MRNRPFRVLTADERAIEALSAALGVSEVVARVLYHRGVRDVEAYRGLLDPERPLSEPGALPDLMRAADIIRAAVAGGRRIRVYGDYDADGVTATAVLLRGLRLLGSGTRSDYYIPNRFDEGYGLSSDAVREAHRDGVDMLVTVDCGSSSPEAADLARELGLVLVITDHHGLPARRPEVPALVNPERMAAPNRLSGAGVALQLVRALLDDEVPDVLYGLAAIGTVADVVPLTGDNRALVRRGLAALGASRSLGVAALFEQDNRAVSAIRADDLGFFVGPRLNAAGRMGDARIAAELLLTDSPDEAAQLSRRLHEINGERRRVERELVEAAWSQLGDRRGADLPGFLVVGGDGWHQGVVGIVASRLKDALRRPVAVVSWDGDEGKGSARGVDGLHLLHHLEGQRRYFTKLGGHRGAAGFSLPRQSLEALSERLSDNLPAAVRVRQYWGEAVDARIRLSAITPEVLSQLRSLEPFGHQFERPRLWVDAEVADVRAVGAEGRHLQMGLAESPIRAVGFGQGAHSASLARGSPVAFVGRLEFTVFQGRERPQWRIEALPGKFPAAAWEGRVRALPAADEELSGRIVWVVNSPRQLSEVAASRGAVALSAARPLGEWRLAEEQARLGMIREVVVSQWRPWPHLPGWADHVVWLAAPRHTRKLAESAWLAADTGWVWMNPEDSPEAVLAKARRLYPGRERLARTWRAWVAGRRPLLIGWRIFDELGLRPGQETGAKRPLQESFSYNAAEEERRWQEVSWERPAWEWIGKGRRE